MESASRSAMSLAERRDNFGLSDESEYPLPRRSRSADSEQSVGSGQRHDYDGDAIMHLSQDDRGDHGVDSSIDTKQEARYCSIMRVTPEKKPWLPPQQMFYRLSDTVSNRY